MSITSMLRWVVSVNEVFKRRLVLQGCSSIAAVLVREGLTTFIDILAEDPDNVLVR